MLNQHETLHLWLSLYSIIYIFILCLLTTTAMGLHNNEIANPTILTMNCASRMLLWMLHLANTQVFERQQEPLWSGFLNLYLSQIHVLILSIRWPIQHYKIEQKMSMVHELMPLLPTNTSPPQIKSHWLPGAPKRVRSGKDGYTRSLWKKHLQF